MAKKAKATRSKRDQKKAPQVTAAVKHALFSLYLHCELHEQAKTLAAPARNGKAAAHTTALKKHRVMSLATAVATLKKKKTPKHLLKFAIMMLARAMPHHGLKHAAALARQLPPPKTNPKARAPSPPIEKVLESFNDEHRGVDREERLHKVRESLAGGPLERYEFSQRAGRMEERSRNHVQ